MCGKSGVIMDESQWWRESVCEEEWEVRPLIGLYYFEQFHQEFQPFSTIP